MCSTTYVESMLLKNSMLFCPEYSLSNKTPTGIIGYSSQYTSRPHSELKLTDLRDAMIHEARVQQPYIEFLGEFLQEMIRRNEDRKLNSCCIACFHGESVEWTVPGYIQRIAKYSEVSPSCFVAALVYLERIFQRWSNLSLNMKTFQRLILVAVMEAEKFLEDETANNRRWAKIGGLSLRELNILELEFLAAMDFNLSVQREDYDRCAASLRSFYVSGHSPAVNNSSDRLAEEKRIFQQDYEKSLSKAERRGVTAMDLQDACKSGKSSPAPAPCGPSPLSPLRRRGDRAQHRTEII